MYYNQLGRNAHQHVSASESRFAPNGCSCRRAFYMARWQQLSLRPLPVHANMPFAKKKTDICEMLLQNHTQHYPKTHVLSGVTVERTYAQSAVLTLQLLVLRVQNIHGCQ